MFDFVNMINNYEQRAVARFEKDDLIIDTASVTDGNHPYETGISHPEYNGGNWVIVQAYDTKEDAQVGHAEWVDKMTSEKLPEALSDCGNSIASQMADIVGCEMEFPRKIN